MGTYNQIALMQYSTIEKELIANAAITPGMLIERMSTNKVRAHATAAGNVIPIMFALENEAEGETIDDAYAAADRVRIGIFNAGDEVYAILADGQTIAIGDPLESNGAGYLRKHEADLTDSDGGTTVYTHCIVGVALEAKTLSGSEDSSGGLGNDQRIKIEIV